MVAIGSAVFGSALGSVTGFVSKQAFSYHFLPSIKDRLRDFITQIALDRLGGFAASIIGRELAMVLSIPVTQFIADLVYGAVKTTVEAIVALASRLLFPQKDVLIAKGLPNFVSNIVAVMKKVVSFATFFFSRAYFCHFGMPFIHDASVFLLQRCITVPAFLPFVPSFVVPSIAGLVALSIAPPVTFFLGDLVGTACAEISTFLIDSLIN